MRRPRSLLALVLAPALAVGFHGSAAEMPAPSKPTPGVELRVRCLRYAVSGKRAQTYWFTFAVEEVLSGTFEDPTFTTQEMFGDFGGHSLMQKVGFPSRLEQVPRQETPVTCRHRAVVKLTPWPDEAGAWRLHWIAREGEEASLRGLERAVEALVVAVERGELDPIRPHLRPGSTVSAKQLRAIAKAHTGEWPGPFSQTARRSLVDERQGTAYLGAGLLPYTFTIVRDPDGVWRIADLKLDAR